MIHIDLNFASEREGLDSSRFDSDSSITMRDETRICITNREIVMSALNSAAWAKIGDCSGINDGTETLIYADINTISARKRPGEITIEFQVLRQLQLVDG
jgi:hypothetical protein